MEQMRCAGCMKLKNNSPVCEHCGHDNRQQNGTHQLPIGTVLKGQYVIGKVLGQGGFGITYLGWDGHLGIPVAIKEYYPNGVVMRDSSRSLSVYNCEGSDSARFETDRQRFLREARTLAQLGNIPEVVHVLGFFPENGTAYIIMEFIRGRTLKQYIQDRGPMPPEAMLTMFGPVFRGLEQVHKAGLIHRDISPDNIMLLPEGRVKLLDFGAVRSYKEEQQQSTESILKHGYAPLEQYQRRGTLGPWTDVYALCGTMYYCMTGKLPPDAPERMLYGEEYPWEEISGLQPHQLDTLKKGTAMLVKDRLPSVEELRRGLSEQAAVSVATSKPDAPENTPVQTTEKKKPAKARKKDRGKNIVALLAALLAGSCLLIGKWIGDQPEPTAQVQTQPETTAPTYPETPTVETTVETTEATQPETRPKEQKALRTDDHGIVQYAADTVTLVSKYNRNLTLTLQGLNIPESYPVDMSQDEGQLYDWEIELWSGDNVMKITTHYFVPIQSKWKGTITIDDMTKYVTVQNGSNSNISYKIQAEWDSQSITWSTNIATVLADCNRYSYYNGYLLEFDAAALDRIRVSIYDRETEQTESWNYTVEPAQEAQES